MDENTNIDPVILAAISKTANAVVFRMKIAGLIKSDTKTAFQKTEELLKNYNALDASADETARKMVRRIDDALELIKDDLYYQVVPLYYIDNWTRERIAEYYNTSVTTISRNKTRLIDRLKVTLFSTDAIKEIFNFDEVPNK